MHFRPYGMIRPWEIVVLVLEWLVQLAWLMMTALGMVLLRLLPGGEMAATGQMAGTQRMQLGLGSSLDGLRMIGLDLDGLMISNNGRAWLVKKLMLLHLMLMLLGPDIAHHHPHTDTRTTEHDQTTC